MKVIFMGTPDFAVGTLKAIIEAGHEVSLVVTQPDKPKGRGGKMAISAVKAAALEYDLPIFQPDRIRKEENIAYLKQYEADVIVVVAFGQILPKEILDMPKYGCVNVHASLLPKYRGAAPIQWAVINGEKVSGVTTMHMDEGLDTGAMLLQEEVELAEDETGGSLFDRLSEVGAKLLIKTLEGLEEGSIKETPQDHEQATHTTIIKKSLGEIDFTKPAAEIECLIRGLNPWPSAFTHYNGKLLKIWKAEVISDEEAKEQFAADLSKAEPGEIAKITKHDLLVKTGQGALSIKELQLEGKKRMDIDAFLRGVQIKEGEKLC
jgi:methionyl-tRNA formyltransferase